MTESLNDPIKPIHTGSHTQTAQQVAEEFADTHWHEPRKVQWDRNISGPPGRFRTTGGLKWYRVKLHEVAPKYKVFAVFEE